MIYPVTKSQEALRDKGLAWNYKVKRRPDTGRFYELATAEVIQPHSASAAPAIALAILGLAAVGAAVYYASNKTSAAPLLPPVNSPAPTPQASAPVPHVVLPQAPAPVPHSAVPEVAPQAFANMNLPSAWAAQGGASSSHAPSTPLASEQGHMLLDISDPVQTHPEPSAFDSISEAIA